MTSDLLASVSARSASKEEAVSYKLHPNPSASPVCHAGTLARLTTVVALKVCLRTRERERERERERMELALHEVDRGRMRASGRR